MIVTFNINNKNDFDTDDFRAAKQVIFIENQKRPLDSLLPCSNDDEVKSSYMLLLENNLNNIHVRNVDDSKTRAIVTRFSDDELKQIHASLIDQVNAGVTPDAIIEKLNADAESSKSVVES